MNTAAPRFGDLRSLLQGDASARRWRQLCMMLDDLEDVPGFEEEILPYCERMLEHWPADLRVLTLDWRERLEDGLLAPQMRLLRELKVPRFGGQITPELFCDEVFASIERCEWKSSDDDTFIEAFVQSSRWPFWRNLRRLNFAGPQVGPRRLVSWLEQVNLDAIEELLFGMKDLSPQDITHLGARLDAAPLRRLDLGGPELSPQAFAAVLQWDALQRVEYFGDLASGPSDEHFALVCGCHWSSLQLVRLSLSQLLALPIENFPALQELRLWLRPEVDPLAQDQDALRAASDKLQQITTLRGLGLLCQGSAASLEPLLHDTRIPNLQSLTLSLYRRPAGETHIPPLGAWLEVDNFPKLKSLGLSGIDHDWLELIESSLCPQLSEIWVLYQAPNLGAAFTQLAQRDEPTALDELSTGFIDLPEEELTSVLRAAEALGLTRLDIFPRDFPSNTSLSEDCLLEMLNSPLCPPLSLHQRILRESTPMIARKVWEQEALESIDDYLQLNLDLPLFDEMLRDARTTQLSSLKLEEELTSTAALELLAQAKLPGLRELDLWPQQWGIAQIEIISKLSLPSLQRLTLRKIDTLARTLLGFEQAQLLAQLKSLTLWGGGDDPETLKRLFERLAMPRLRRLTLDSCNGMLGALDGLLDTTRFPSLVEVSTLRLECTEKTRQMLEQARPEIQWSLR